MDSSKENFISEIHNYCDRWCEKCSFTSRCRVYAIEQEYGLDEENPEIEKTLTIVSTAFADAERMLLEKAHEMGIDLNSAIDDPEIEASLNRTKNWVDSQPAVKQAMQLTIDGMKFLDRVDEWFPQSDDKIILEQLTVIQWFIMTIGVKVSSSYRGLIDIDGHPDPVELNDTQSYANGTAKITLLIIQRSINAWSYLTESIENDEIPQFLNRLKQIKGLLEKDFPNAYEFVRPGFDELETVM